MYLVMTITYTRANLATKSTMIANPLVENLLSDLGLLGRLSSDSSFSYPAWFQRQRKITDIVVDLGNKSVQSQRLVFSVFEPEGGGGLDSSGGVTKNVIRDQLLEVPNLTRTYPKIRRQQTSIFRATLPNDFVSSDETPQLPFPDYFESFLEQVWILLSRVIIFASMYL